MQELQQIPCKWQACTRSFSQKGEMLPHVSNSHLAANHINYNTGLNCKWSQCDTKFPTLDELLQHIGSHHLNFNNEKLNICLWKDCGLQFNNFEELTNHAIQEHVKSGKNSYVCQWFGCLRNGKGFNQRPGILRHLQTRLYFNRYWR